MKKKKYCNQNLFKKIVLTCIYSTFSCSVCSEGLHMWHNRIKQTSAEPEGLHAVCNDAALRSRIAFCSQSNSHVYLFTEVKYMNKTKFKLLILPIMTMQITLSCTQYLTHLYVSSNLILTAIWEMCKVDILMNLIYFI